MKDEAFLKKPVDIRPASTLIMIRKCSDEIQVNLVKRSETSGFMSGKYVFPGGAIDDQDRDVELWRPRMDMDQDEMANRFGGGLQPEEIIAYGVSAIRETFEEAGVLLAERGSKEVGIIDDHQARPSRGICSNDGFQKKILSEDWILQFSRLFRWSHWITPELMRKRYDTRFFLSVVPAGTVCRPDHREVTESLWVTPKKALAGNIDGEISLSPPTLVTLHELLGYPEMEMLEKEAGHRKWGEPLLPRLIPLEKGSVIIEPWDSEYRDKEIRIDQQQLKSSVVPVGTPFSRIWHDGMVWRPVGR
ncbi:MAG: hypothetical protein V1714_03500 [Pseudomonadota bacterium]